MKDRISEFKYRITNNTYRKSNDFQELIYLYDVLIHHTMNLIYEMSIDDPIEICSFYYYLYQNGYLSYLQDFRLDMEESFHPYLEINLPGSYLPYGKGVCRHLVIYLNDLLNKMNIKSYSISSEYPSNNTLNNHPNHLLNYIKDEQPFFYDPTHFEFLMQTEKNNMKCFYANNLNHIQKDYYFIYPKLYLRSMDNPISNNFLIPDHEYLENMILKITKTQELCKNNQDILKKFYLQNQNIYQNIHDNIDHTKTLKKAL